jgi:hypothetical protein
MQDEPLMSRRGRHDSSQQVCNKAFQRNRTSCHKISNPAEIGISPVFISS